MIVLDASVLLATEDAGDPHYDDAKALLANEDQLATLDLAAYEVTNVAVRAWRDPDAANRLSKMVFSIKHLGHLVRIDSRLVVVATEIAERHAITTYDAAYAAAARSLAAQLVSCDQRDLVGNGLAVLPGDALERR